MATNFAKVYSASRMTDMVGWYPNELIQAYNARIAKGETCHTLMLWTKFPGALLQEPLHSFLLHIRDNQAVQLALQLTVTGMGGTWLEPNVPECSESIALLPSVINLLGDPRRIRFRIDPLLRFKDPSGKTTSNYEAFEPILAAALQFGITEFSTSFVENDAHSKVTKRFNDLGLPIVAPSKDERMQIIDAWADFEQKYGVRISSCAVPGAPMSACIDADLLEQLHPQHLPLDHRKKKSRPLCGCCMDIDLGGWPPKACPSGCRYCYSNPVIPTI